MCAESATSEQGKDALIENLEKQLAWYHTLACRFKGSNFPRMGTPLYGYRFRLQYEDVEGWNDWTDDGR